jgi:hypothetical protein
MFGSGRLRVWDGLAFTSRAAELTEGSSEMRWAAEATPSAARFASACASEIPGRRFKASMCGAGLRTKMNPASCCRGLGAAFEKDLLNLSCRIPTNSLLASVA